MQRTLTLFIYNFQLIFACEWNLKDKNKEKHTC